MKKNLQEKKEKKAFIKLKVGKKKPTITGELKTLSYSEIQFLCSVDYPEDTFIYCLLESKIFKRVTVKGKVISSEIKKKDGLNTSNLITVLIVYHNDDYAKMLDKINVVLERRKNARFNVSYNVDFFYPQHFPVAVSNNLSLYGISIYTMKKLRNDDIIGFKIKLPDVLDEIVVFGKVIYTKTVDERRLVGLEFVRLIDDTRQKLQEVINKLKKYNIDYEIIGIDYD